MTWMDVAACMITTIMFLGLGVGCYIAGYSNGNCDGFKAGLRRGRAIERGEP